MNRTAAALLGVLALPLLSCSNAYQEYYTDLLKGKPVSSVSHLIPNNGLVELYRGTTPDEDNAAMFENGYVLIGYSSFNGPLNSQNDPLAVARKVRAHVVVVYGTYTNTVAGSIPYTVRSPGTYVTTNSTGTIYGTAGSATYTGTTQTYVPGTSTTHQIPYSIDRYDQTASFWVKAKPPRFGVAWRELTPDERARLQRNRGVVVMAVVKGSAAFMADIMRGDILIRFGPDDVIDGQSAYGLLDKYEGQDVEVTLWRSDTEIRKVLRIRPAAP
jgi:hypothetical protein